MEQLESSLPYSQAILTSISTENLGTNWIWLIFYIVHIWPNSSTCSVVPKIGKIAGNLQEGLHDFIVCLLIKKNYVFCEVRPEVEVTVQDLTTTEAGHFPYVLRADSEDIIYSLNITTRMLYSLTRVHCCQDTK
jgi:hypothetical protein